MQFENPIFKQISTLKNLPSLPHILLKLLEACNQDQGGLDKISDIVHTDPSLSAKILRLVNSAYFGLPRKVEDIRQAVVLVGMNGVKNVAVCACVYEAFNKARGNGAFDLKGFWWHSLRCAFFARRIAEGVKYDEPDEAFLSGLLHDIGKLVFWVNFRKNYEELLESSSGRPELLLEGEARLGATHCEIAAWLLERWNLQSVVSDPILYHHEPPSRIRHALPLVQIVYIAHALCRERASDRSAVLGIAKKVFGLEEEGLMTTLSESDVEASEVARMLDIDIEPSEAPKSAPSAKDRKKQETLVREVKNVSLLVGTLQGFLEAEDQDHILEVISKGLKVLFDVKRTLFFIRDAEKGLLRGKVPGKKGFSNYHALTVALNMEEGLPVKALAEGRALDSFHVTESSSPVILDAQITRFLGKEGIFCLPLIAQAEPVGVLVIGLDRAELSHLSKYMKLLDIFLHNGALALRLEQLRRNRLQTIQSERFGASANIARRVVHEVNNPLGIIKNYLKILGIKLAKQKVAQDEIRIISEEIDRVAEILRELSNFSSEKPVRKEKVDINSLLLDILKITRESLVKDSRVELQLDLERSLPAVHAEKDGLKQVFINLIKNAAEAMAGGGNLQIQTRYVPQPLEAQPEGEDSRFRGYVEITFNDDGPGIPEEIKAKLFEPYVSSKKGSHSGLGLSVAHNIIETLNGKITCESHRDTGTEFKIELPVLSDQKP